MFDEAGITKIPETMAELIDACKKIEAKGETAIACGIKDSWSGFELVTSCALMPFIESDAWVRKLINKEIDFTDSKYVDMLRSVKELVEYFRTDTKVLDMRIHSRCSFRKQQCICQVC